MKFGGKNALPNLWVMISMMIGLILCAVPAWSAPTARSYPVLIDRVVDGDTLELSGHRLFGQKTSIRLLASKGGVDTPEKGPRAKCKREAVKAARASAFTAELVARAGNRATLRNPKHDKFGGRFDAQVILKIDGQFINLGDALIRAGHARAYDGKKRGSWCGSTKGPTS